MMVRKDIGMPLDRENRNNHNHNYKELYGIVKDFVGAVADEVFEQIIDASKINWKEPVDQFDDLPEGSQEGDTRMVRETGKIYRFNGEEWQEIQEIDPTAINEVENRLSKELKNTEKNLSLVESLKFDYAFSIHWKDWNIDYQSENFEINSFQSMVLTDDNLYITVAQTPSTKPKGLIVELDRESLELKRHLFTDIYHSNGMAYCDNYNGKEVLVIANLWNDIDNKSNTVTIVDLETFDKLEDVSLSENARSIGYDKKEEIFITVTDDFRIKYDKNFNELERFEKEYTGVSQANTLDNGFNIIPQVSPHGVKIEDYDGKTLKNYSVYLYNIGEIEQIYPIDNGRLLAMTNAGKNYPINFYEFTLYTYRGSFVNSAESDSRNNIGRLLVSKKIYVDANAAQGGNGESNKPFKRISDALYNVKETGNYEIIIKKGTYNENIRATHFYGRIFFIGEKGVKIKGLQMSDIFGEVRLCGEMTFFGKQVQEGSEESSVNFRNVNTLRIYDDVKFIGEGDYDKGTAIQLYQTNMFVDKPIKVENYDRFLKVSHLSRVGISGSQDISVNNSDNVLVQAGSILQLTSGAVDSITANKTTGSYVLTDRMRKTLWTGSAKKGGDVMNLSESIEKFDKLDIVFDNSGQETRSFYPKDGYPLYLKGINLINDGSSIRINISEMKIDKESNTKFKVNFNDRWDWSGNKNDDAQRNGFDPILEVLEIYGIRYY